MKRILITSLLLFFFAMIQSSDLTAQGMARSKGLGIRTSFWNVTGEPTRISVINETGALSDLTILNGHVSVANLQDKYHRFGRILINGTMNNQSVTFNSAERTKIGETFKIPYQDGGFNFFLKKKTFIGYGKLEKVRTTLKDDMSELLLSYD